MPIPTATGDFAAFFPMLFGSIRPVREVFKIRSSTAILVPDRRANSKGWGKFDFAAGTGRLSGG